MSATGENEQGDVEREPTEEELNRIMANMFGGVVTAETPMAKVRRYAFPVLIASIISWVVGPLLALLGINLMGFELPLTVSSWGGLAVIFTALRIAA